jgi:hypothetical protein
MKIEQSNWTSAKGWFSAQTATNNSFSPQFVLVFSSGAILKDESVIGNIKDKYPNAILIGCSTSGEISGSNVRDNSIALTAVELEKTAIKHVSISIDDYSDSYNCGKSLVEKFDKNGLKHVFLLSDGLNVNGSELVKGLRDTLPKGVAVTGGLAGDAADFNETNVIGDNGAAGSKIISAIGFYGDSLHVGYGSFGGWDSFGLDRTVTKSENNVLYEIDGVPALELYKSFLGDKADELPGSGLLFPLSLRTKTDEAPVVRTILAVDESNQSITFAGDLPEGSSIRLMKANIDRLVSGSVKAAETSILPLNGVEPDLAILISCVGRKLVLKQMVEEEVEAAMGILGKDTTVTGFYSYGEISPFSNNSTCELHNQTMTITTFTEL